MKNPAKNPEGFFAERFADIPDARELASAVQCTVYPAAAQVATTHNTQCVQFYSTPRRLNCAGRKPSSHNVKK